MTVISMGKIALDLSENKKYDFSNKTNRLRQEINAKLQMIIKKCNNWKHCF